MPSVLSCRLDENQEFNAEFNLDRQRAYHLEYHIDTDGLIGPISLVGGALLVGPNPLPDIWDTYSFQGDGDTDAFCSRIATKKISYTLYKAMLDFATLPSGRDPGESEINPLFRPVRYRGAKLVMTRAVWKDIDGKLIVTSANEEFEEPLERDISYAVLVATRNIATIDQWVVDMATFIDTVNGGVYRTRASREWWCLDIELSDQKFEAGVSYYEETWQIAFNFEKWNEVILDRGWKVLDDSVNPAKQVNAKDDDGKDLTAPVLLDGSGKKLPKGQEPVGRTFRVIREANWGSIPV